MTGSIEKNLAVRGCQVFFYHVTVQQFLISYQSGSIFINGLFIFVAHQ